MENPLIDAIECRNLERLDKLLIMGVYDDNSLNHALLHAYAKSTLKTAALLLLKYGADPDNIMYDACKQGDRFMVDLLIKMGAQNFDSGLFGALTGKQDDLIKDMEGRGATLEKFNYFGLREIVLENNIKFIEHILKCGKTIFACVYTMREFIENETIFTLTMSLDKSFDPWQCFYVACEMGHIGTIRTLLQKYLSQFDLQRLYSGFYAAMRKNHINASMYLLVCGALRYQKYAYVNDDEPFFPIMSSYFINRRVLRINKGVAEELMRRTQNDTRLWNIAKQFVCDDLCKFIGGFIGVSKILRDVPHLKSQCQIEVLS